MPIKIERTDTTSKIPAKIEDMITRITGIVPPAHLRGIERIRIVDTISNARLKGLSNSALPGLYHPKQGTQPAWLEISAHFLLPPSAKGMKKLLSRLSFKNNLAAVIISLIAQHYFLTLRHSIKKQNLETSIRSYTENHLRQWNAREHKLRTRIFKPLQPLLERWSKTLSKNQKAARKDMKA